MAFKLSWTKYKTTYRQQEMERLADWILSGVSGSVVGLGGAGKSNLLCFLCHRPDALAQYLGSHSESVVVIPLDLNNLPANDSATFYRVILRSFNENGARFQKMMLQQKISELFEKTLCSQDPFVSQTALRELLFLLQKQGKRVVFVMDRFEKFCQKASAELTDNLRGLRDTFKETLCYIIGMRQEVIYLEQPEVLGELYELLDLHICRVGPMNNDDARQMIHEETVERGADSLSSDEIDQLLSLTGGYPALLKAACASYRSNQQTRSLKAWQDILLAQSNIQHRLKEIWDGLTQEEQLVLVEVRKLQNSKNSANKWNQLHHKQEAVLNALKRKGLCQETKKKRWQIFSLLFSAYVAQVGWRTRGRIWFDADDNQFYQGQTALTNLTPLERKALEFFVNNPKVRLTHDTIIEHVYEGQKSDEIDKGVLAVVIYGLRKKIEPNSPKWVYITTCRGHGFQFFPEGRPS